MEQVPAWLAAAVAAAGVATVYLGEGPVPPIASSPEAPPSAGPSLH